MKAPRPLAVDYDVYEIAYLAGGPCRAVDAAIAALTQTGRVTVGYETGQLSVAGDRSHHWLEAALLDAIEHRGHRTVRTLRRRAKADSRFAGIRRRLQGDGLLRRSAPTLPPRFRTWQTVALTGEGRRTLRRLRAGSPAGRVVGAPCALQVALGGPAAMSDTALRSILFDPPLPPYLPGSPDLRRDPYLVGFEACAGSGAAMASRGGWGD